MMKKNFCLRCSLPHLLFALLLLTLAGCSRGKSSAEPFSLDGAWMLTNLRVPPFINKDYPLNGKSLLYIYDGDSLLYECLFVFGSNGNSITPLRCDTTTFICKGNGEYIYLEKSDGSHPLNVIDDTTITIQKWGRICTFVRERTIPPVRLAKYRKLIAESKINYSNGNVNSIIYNDKTDFGLLQSYVFSEVEEELKNSNATLAYLVAAALVALMAVLFFARDSVRRRRQMERQLSQLQAEHDNRPQRVVEALKSVEDDFFASEYYFTLCALVKKGKAKPGDWDQLRHRIDGVYPGFTSKLSGLYKFSDVEFKVCLLLKLRLSPSEIADALHKETSSISSIRSRLFLKVFGKKGSAKEWDEFIDSL